MLFDFKAANGVTIRVKEPIKECMVIEPGKQAMSCTIIHAQFDEVIVRNALGSHTRQKREAIAEYILSLGADTAKWQRQDGKTKTIKLTDSEKEK